MVVNILLVDDEPNVLEGLVRALRKEPYNLLTATSGLEALSILEAYQIDLIVADEKMPNMSGSQLFERVKTEYPSVVRIMLTGDTNVETAMSAIHTGWVFQFLQKPCRPPELAAALHYGLLARSLLRDGEDPQLRMSQDGVDNIMAEKLSSKR